MKRVAAVIGGILVLILSFSGAAVSQDYAGTPGAFPSCQACHETAEKPEYTEWLTTAHATAYDSANAFVQTTALCLQCHTTGWSPNNVNAGADDFVTIDINGTVTIADSAAFFKKVNVQCESCHGPTQFNENHPPDVSFSTDICGECHQGVVHPFLEEWLTATHAQSDSNEVPFMQQMFRNDPVCSGCHTVQGFIEFVNATGDSVNAVPNITKPPGADAFPLVCSACHDPHNKIHESQLRLPPEKLCIKCHNCMNAQPPLKPTHPMCGMWSGEGAVEFPGVTYRTVSAHQMIEPIATKRCVGCHVNIEPFVDENNPGYMGHTFLPRLEVCSSTDCHEETIDDFDFRGRQTTIDSLLGLIQNKLSHATSADSTTEAFQQALFNYYFVLYDRSSGVHNFNYAYDVLVSTNDFIDTFITSVEIETDDSPDVPMMFALHQNYPNPFNTGTTIPFDLREAGRVELVLYNTHGRVIKKLVDRQLPAGRHKMTFSATDLPSGVYIYSLYTKKFTDTHKMILMK